MKNVTNFVLEWIVYAASVWKSGQSKWKVYLVNLMSRHIWMK